MVVRLLLLKTGDIDITFIIIAQKDEHDGKVQTASRRETTNHYAANCNWQRLHANTELARNPEPRVTLKLSAC